ncbi:MAG: S8 family serine peptidase [Dehalococcoidia bacterium]|nr:S8 family serine peptidase [Dehalococcoidia bacterium]
MGGTLIEDEEEEYWRLDFTTQTYVVIDAVTSSKVSLDAEILDASGTELGENIYSFDGFLGYVPGDGLIIRERLSPGTYFIRVKLASRLEPRPVPYSIVASEDVQFAQYFDTCNARTQALNNPSISDPLYACQWHLESNEYVDINIESAWDAGALGEGVNVALVDQGLDYRHEDLKDNVDLTLSHDYNDEDEIYDRSEHHGTHVAGILAARDNSVGMRGVAPRATLFGYNPLSGFTRISELADAMTRNADITAVSNNSWGIRQSVRAKRVSTLWERAIESGLDTGYGGKGTFYVFSGGNGHLLGDDSNLDEYANYYGVTAACSVQGWGARAPHSEMGANLWVCAPSNERPGVRGLAGRFGVVTTEHSDNYVQDFGGTSAAAPVVSGVAALMRSVNPELTWRDLKLILAASAQKNDPNNAGWEDGARKYRSGSAADRYHFNHEFGFGLVDAGAAVELATEWVNVPYLEIGGASSGKLSTTIPDATLDGESTTVSSSITLENDIGFTEFVEVNIELRHRSFRDLEVELVSPSGAVSRLPVPHDTSTDLFTYTDFIPLYGSFRFGSARLDTWERIRMESGHLG